MRTPVGQSLSCSSLYPSSALRRGSSGFLGTVCQTRTKKHWTHAISIDPHGDRRLWEWNNFPKVIRPARGRGRTQPLLCPPLSWAGSLRHSINVKPCPSCNSRRFLTIAPKRNCTLVLPLINIRGRKGAAYRGCRMHFQLWPSYVQYLTHTLVGSPPPPTLDRTVVYKLLLAADFFFPSKLFHKTSIYDSPIIGNSQNV